MGDGSRILRTFREVRVDFDLADYDQAIDALSRTSNSQSLFWASEIALNKAHAIGTTDSDAVAEAIFDAKRLNTRSRMIQLDRNVGLVDALIARAKIRYANMHTHAALAAEGRLPTRVEAEKAYSDTIDIGMDVVRVINEDYPSNGRKGNLPRVADEVGALLIGQRFGLNPDIGPETWWPYQSLVRENRAWSKDSEFSKTWDYSIFTGLGEVAELEYRVRLAKSDDRGIQPPGISFVKVDPDLRSFIGEPKPISEYIINECYQEQTGTACSRTTTQLDNRTTLFLEAIDRKVVV